MKKSKEFKQLFLDNHTKYDELKDKIVDKVAFYDKDNYDCNMCVVMFTDKTYIALGVDYGDLARNDTEPMLTNYYVSEPQSINNGDFECHSWVDNDGKLHFDSWIQILKDFGIWDIDEEEAKKIIERKRKMEKDREYDLYLKLKEKYENKN